MKIETRFNSDTKLVVTPVDPREKQIMTLALTGNRCVRIEPSGDDWVLTFVPAMLRIEAVRPPSENTPSVQLAEELVEKAS
jgi:hypothetical protein